MKTLYTAHAITKGGRGGHSETDDGVLKLELGKPGTAGKTNPEQLFACGYSACFGSALDSVAQKQGVDASQSEVHADVNLNQDESGGYLISVTLGVLLPGVAADVAQKLVETAHQVCPYSKATRGNIEVTLKVL